MNQIWRAIVRNARFGDPVSLNAIELVSISKTLSVPESSCESQRPAVSPNRLIPVKTNKLFWALLNLSEPQLASVGSKPFVLRDSSKAHWVLVNPNESQMSLCENFSVPVCLNELFSYTSTRSTCKYQE